MTPPMYRHYKYRRPDQNGHDNPGRVDPRRFLPASSSSSLPFEPPLNSGWHLSNSEFPRLARSSSTSSLTSVGNSHDRRANASLRPETREHIASFLGPANRARLAATSRNWRAASVVTPEETASGWDNMHERSSLDHLLRGGMDYLKRKDYDVYDGKEFGDRHYGLTFEKRDEGDSRNYTRGNKVYDMRVTIGPSRVANDGLFRGTFLLRFVGSRIHVRIGHAKTPSMESVMRQVFGAHGFVIDE